MVFVPPERIVEVGFDVFAERFDEFGQTGNRRFLGVFSGGRHHQLIKKVLHGQTLREQLPRRRNPLVFLHHRMKIRIPLKSESLAPLGEKIPKPRPRFVDRSRLCDAENDIVGKREHDHRLDDAMVCRRNNTIFF